MRKSRLAIAPAALALSACIAPPLSAPQPSGICENRTTVRQSVQNKVDVLFVVDNSNSMDAMQEELRQRFGEFLKVFSTLADQGTFADLQIGVVTTDYGAGATGAPGCQPSPGGQMGRLQATGAQAASTCQPPVGANFIKYRFDAAGGAGNLPTGQDLAATFTCMASVGAHGCGFEHVLESAYAALHNDIPENAGFLRDGALLAVVFLTNEDDSSSPPDSDLFDKAKTGPYGYEDSFRSTRFGIVCGDPGAEPPYGDSMGPLSGCRPAPGPLEYDVARYINFFTKPAIQGGVKEDPDDVILVAIDGPSEPVQVILSNPGTPLGQDYVVCPQINEASNPPCVPVLQHSCRNVAQPGFFADPAVRLNAVIQAAHQHRISSICDTNYTDALQGVGDLISIELGTGCIPVADPTLADCAVEDVTKNGDGTTTVAVIERCSDPPSAFPCWTLDAKQACQRTAGGHGITIQRNGALPPAHTTARVACGEPCP
jgi:hypothetical protein